MTLNKILAPLAAVAFMALVAVSLVATTGTASAEVQGVTQTATTVNPSGPVTFTIITEAGDGDLVATASTGTWTDCDSVDDADSCDDYTGNATRVATVGDDANDGEIIRLQWTAPDTGPRTVTFSFNQSGDSVSASVKVRGEAAAVEVTVLDAGSTSTTACAGTVAHVIDGAGVNTAGLDAGTLCTRVLDSAGNRIQATIVYTTTEGDLSANSDATGATGAVADSVTIANGDPGTEATITASADGVDATTTVKFGGEPDSCNITTNPASVGVGGSASIMIEVLDEDDGPVADGNVVFIQQVNPGQGANAAILNDEPVTSNGVATTTVIAAIQGNIALGAESDDGTAICTGSLLATGQVVPPGGGEPGDGSFEVVGGGSLNASGPTEVRFGGTIADLNDVVADNDIDAVFAFDNATGRFLAYFPDVTVAVVNADFLAKFPNGVPADTTLYFVK